MMLFKVGDEVRVRQPTNLFHSELGKVVSIDHVKLTYKVMFNKGGSDTYTCFDLILVDRQEEKDMKFKVGDRVKVLNSWYGRNGEIGNVINVRDWGNYKFEVEFQDGCKESFRRDELELMEEEKDMKFKVGDKVKVKDSWFGFTGEVGLIVRIDESGKYPYRVKFNVFDEEDEEVFAEGSLELVKEKEEKQSFTKSDLKTGMGVVLRDGSKGHVLIGTPTQDTIRFIEKNEWMGLKDYDDDLTAEGFKDLDIVAVYNTRFENQYMTDRVFEQDVLYERKEEPTKMTMKEINEHFGKQIEIVE